MAPTPPHGLHQPHISHLRSHGVKLGQRHVDLPDATVVVADGNEAVIAVVEPAHGQPGVVEGRSTANRPPRLSIPNHECIVVLEKIYEDDAEDKEGEEEEAEEEEDKAEEDGTI